MTQLTEPYTQIDHRRARERRPRRRRDEPEYRQNHGQRAQRGSPKETDRLTLRYLYAKKIKEFKPVHEIPRYLRSLSRAPLPAAVMVERP